MIRWREPDRVDRQIADLWAGVALATVALAPLWRAMLPGLPPCPLRTLSGWPCAACGAGRAAEALLGGDVLTAVAFNPLLVLAAAALVVVGLAAPLWVRSGRTVPALVAPLPGWVRGSMALGIVGNWLYVLVRGV